MDEPPQIWPPPIKRSADEPRPTIFVKWRRHSAPAGQWALRLSGFGVLAIVAGFFFFLLIPIGWIIMTAGFITGLWSYQSIEGKLAILIPLVVVALIYGAVGGYL